MGIGTGITLAVLGLILLTGVVQVDIPWIDEYALGGILIIAGIVSVVLAMTVWRDRSVGYGSRGGRVVERREVERDDPIL